MEITDAKLKKAISLRCKECQCGEPKDEKLCKNCLLSKGSNLHTKIVRYCKDCRGGNGLEYCGCESTCALYPYMTALIKEMADKIQGAKK